MKIEPPGGSHRPRREHPTSSRHSAIAWLRSQNRRTPRELRLLLEVLRFVQAIKVDERRRKASWKEAARKAKRLRARANALQQAYPDVLKIKVEKAGGTGWLRPYLQRRVDLAFAEFPRRLGAATRFGRALGALEPISSTAIGTLAAACLLIAARCVRMKQNISGLEAAALAVAVGMEPRGEHENQCTEAEHRWRARFRLIRPRVREALLDHALPLRNALLFEDGRLVPIKGVKRTVPRS